MKKLISVLLLLAIPTTVLAAAGFPSPANVEKILNLGGAEGIRKVQLGTQVTRKKVQIMRAQYNFATQGGSVSSINLKDVDGADAVIPSKSIIGKVWIDVLTDLASSFGAAKVAINLQTQGDLKAATAYTAYTSAALIAGITTGSVTNMFKLTADRTLVASVTTASLTAGKFDVFVEYYLGE